MIALGFIGCFLVGMLAGAALAVEAYKEQVRERVKEAKQFNQEARKILERQTDPDMVDVMLGRHRD